MGRKSRLKKIRKQEGNIKKTDSKSKKDNFINEIERQGYQFNNALDSPEIPEEKTDPQV
ncbi:MAG: hypothetical protein ACFBSE_15510 [Prochloraceae cyanobacterium]